MMNDGSYHHDACIIHRLTAPAELLLSSSRERIEPQRSELLEPSEATPGQGVIIAERVGARVGLDQAWERTVVHPVAVVTELRPRERSSRMRVGGENQAGSHATNCGASGCVLSGGVASAESRGGTEGRRLAEVRGISAATFAIVEGIYTIAPALQQPGPRLQEGPRAGVLRLRP